MTPPIAARHPSANLPSTAQKLSRAKPKNAFGVLDPNTLPVTCCERPQAI